jgi:hypothetical protein
MNHPEVTGTPARAGKRFWIAGAAGWVVIGYGLRGLLHHHVDTRPGQLAAFVVAGALLHDLLFAPVVLVLGVVVSRVVPGPARAAVQAALVVSGCLALFSYPLVRDYAHILHNPSSLPHDYGANLALVLGVVWAVATVTVLVRLRRRSRSG